MELYSHSIRNSCNRIFLFDYALYEEFYQENPACIYYLPLGSNYHRIDNLIGTITKEDETRFSADISFVGSLYTEKCPYNHLKEDGSYLKLRTLSIGYTIRKPFQFINSVRFNVVANNLLTFTKYRGYDPEVNSFGSTPSLRGIDSGAYPQQRSFTLGLNVIF